MLHVLSSVSDCCSVGILESGAEAGPEDFVGGEESGPPGEGPRWGLGATLHKNELSA